MKVQAQNDGRRVVVMRLPCRKTAAAFAILGVLVAAAQLHDESLNWDTLASLPIGTQIYWREPTGNSRPKSGRILGLSILDGTQLMVVSVDNRSRQGQTTHSFARTSALKNKITLGAISAKTNAQLVGLSRVLSILGVEDKSSWLTAPRFECLLLSEKATFLSDLVGLSINTLDDAIVTLEDALAISENSGKKYSKTKLASPRQDAISDQIIDVIVLDGASAVKQLQNANAKSVIAILSNAEYDNDVEHEIGLLAGYRRDEFVVPPTNGVLEPPAQIDVVVFGLPSSNLQVSAIDLIA